ncbi:unnamed protein product [Tilletia controversa]|nr:unnamed protein product [Tilletia controversa]
MPHGSRFTSDELPTFPFDASTDLEQVSVYHICWPPHFLLNLFLGDGRNVGFSLVTYAKKVTWSTANSQTGTGEETSWATAPGVTNSSRTDLHYGSDFNRDDLTLTEGECDAFFPKLWKDLNRVKAYYSQEQPFDKEYTWNAPVPTKPPLSSESSSATTFPSPPQRSPVWRSYAGCRWRDVVNVGNSVRRMALELPSLSKRPHTPNNITNLPPDSLTL